MSERDHDRLEPIFSSDEEGFYVELAGHRLRRDEATALAARLLQAVHGRAPRMGAPLGEDGAPRARFTPGLDKARLDRFLRATSDERPKPAPPATNPPPIARAAEATPAVPPLRLGGDARAPEPPPVEEPAPRRAPPRNLRDPLAADFVHQRASEWWDRASDNDVPLGARGEARMIAAELFQLAEELRRGERPRDEDE